MPAMNIRPNMSGNIVYVIAVLVRIFQRAIIQSVLINLLSMKKLQPFFIDAAEPWVEYVPLGTVSTSAMTVHDKRTICLYLARHLLELFRQTTHSLWTGILTDELARLFSQWLGWLDWQWSDSMWRLVQDLPVVIRPKYVFYGWKFQYSPDSQHTCLPLQSSVACMRYIAEGEVIRHHVE